MHSLIAYIVYWLELLHSLVVFSVVVFHLSGVYATPTSPPHHFVCAPSNHPYIIFCVHHPHITPTPPQAGGNKAGGRAGVDDLTQLVASLPEEYLQANRGFVKGDRVRAVSGELAGLTGVVVGLTTEDRIEVKADMQELTELLVFDPSELTKSFHKGDHVKVSSGPAQGQTGLVVKVEEHICWVFTDTSKEEIQVFARDLVEAAAAETTSVQSYVVMMGWGWCVWGGRGDGHCIVGVGWERGSIAIHPPGLPVHADLHKNTHLCTYTCTRTQQTPTTHHTKTPDTKTHQQKHRFGQYDLHDLVQLDNAVGVVVGVEKDACQVLTNMGQPGRPDVRTCKASDIRRRFDTGQVRRYVYSVWHVWYV